MRLNFLLLKIKIFYFESLCILNYSFIIIKFSFPTHAFLYRENDFKTEMRIHKGRLFL